MRIEKAGGFVSDGRVNGISNIKRKFKFVTSNGRSRVQEGFKVKGRLIDDNCCS